MSLGGAICLDINVKMFSQRQFSTYAVELLSIIDILSLHIQLLPCLASTYKNTKERKEGSESYRFRQLL